MYNDVQIQNEVKNYFVNHCTYTDGDISVKIGLYYSKIL